MSIVPFSFGGAEVRVVMRGREPWFIHADICKVLDIGNPSEALRRLDDDERGSLTLAEGAKINGLAIGASLPTVISEAGLYRLVMRSDKPQAKPFQKWVTAEVLPSIRKTGGYGKQDPMALLNDPALLRDLSLYKLLSIGRAALPPPPWRIMIHEASTSAPTLGLWI